MGRFDALTQLDNKPARPSPSLREIVKQPETPKARKPENLKTGNLEDQLPHHPENQNSGKLDFVLSRKPEIVKSGKPENLKNEKYSTLLQPSLIKQIKQYALEHDMKDYEVIQQAVQAYLEQKI